MHVTVDYLTATAIALLKGVHPGDCSFNQSQMCQHLYKCFNQGRITQFPVLKQRRGGKEVKYSDNFQFQI